MLRLLPVSPNPRTTWSQPSSSRRPILTATNLASETASTNAITEASPTVQGAGQVWVCLLTPSIADDTPFVEVKSEAFCLWNPRRIRACLPVSLPAHIDFLHDRRSSVLTSTLSLQIQTHLRHYLAPSTSLADRLRSALSNNVLGRNFCAGQVRLSGQNPAEFPTALSRRGAIAICTIIVLCRGREAQGTSNWKSTATRLWFIASCAMRCSG